MKNYTKIIFGLLSIVICVSFFALPAVAEDPYKTIAREFSKYASKLTTRKIAVIPFTYVEGGEASGGTIVSERIITQLVNLGEFEVVERAQIEKVLKELNLQTTGIIDQSSAKEIGKILGVEAIITGSLIQKTNGLVEVNARLISTETAKVLCASGVNVERDWNVKGEAQTQQYYTPTQQYSAPANEYVAPAYQGPAPVVIIDIMGGVYNNSTMDLEFSNSYYGQKKDWLGLTGSFSDGFTKIEWRDLGTISSLPPLGVRFGIMASEYLGFLMEFSYSSYAINSQTTTFWLDGVKQGTFYFSTDDYFKVNFFTMGFGILPVIPIGKNFDIFFGAALNMNLCFWEAPYVKGYTGGSNVFLAPSEDMELGFGFTVPVGMHIYFTDGFGIFAEGRYTYNTFNFTRTVDDENDKAGVTSLSAFAGLSFKVR